jgi:catechol-2,3-dioxygenase
MNDEHVKRRTLIPRTPRHPIEEKTKMSQRGHLRPGHVCIRVTDMNQAVKHYTDHLGLIETDRDDLGRVYLKGWDEYDWFSVVLRETQEAGMDFMAFKVRGRHGRRIHGLLQQGARRRHHQAPGARQTASRLLPARQLGRSPASRGHHLEVRSGPRHRPHAPRHNAGKTIYFFDPSGNRSEVFAGGSTWYPDHPTVTWNAEKLGKAIFYHDRQLNENFLSVVT